MKKPKVVPCDCDLCAWKDGARCYMGPMPEPEQAAAIVDAVTRAEVSVRAMEEGA